MATSIGMQKTVRLREVFGTSFKARRLQRGSGRGLLQPVALIIFAAVLLAGTAQADDKLSGAGNWICTYKALPLPTLPNVPQQRTDDNLTDSIEFILNENSLTETEWYINYTVLENNEYALVRTAHWAERNKYFGTLEISTTTIMVDKSLGKFVFNAVSFRSGSCSKK
jgi:hypothetical protein